MLKISDLNILDVSLKALGGYHLKNILVHENGLASIGMISKDSWVKNMPPNSRIKRGSRIMINGMKLMAYKSFLNHTWERRGTESSKFYFNGYTEPDLNEMLEGFCGFNDGDVDELMKGLSGNATIGDLVNLARSKMS